MNNLSTDIPKIGWEKIREILISNGFEESQNDGSAIHLKKNKTEIRIPKVKLLSSIFIKYVILTSGISQEKFV